MFTRDETYDDTAVDDIFVFNHFLYSSLLLNLHHLCYKSFRDYFDKDIIIASLIVVYLPDGLMGEFFLPGYYSPFLRETALFVFSEYLYSTAGFCSPFIMHFAIV